MTKPDPILYIWIQYGTTVLTDPKRGWFTVSKTTTKLWVRNEQLVFKLMDYNEQIVQTVDLQLHVDMILSHIFHGEALRPISNEKTFHPRRTWKVSNDQKSNGIETKQNVLRLQTPDALNSTP